MKNTLSTAFLLMLCTPSFVLPIQVMIEATNTTKQPVSVELYEKLTQEMIQLDTESAQPTWEGRFVIKPGNKRRFVKDIEEGSYQINAYFKTRKKPLKKVYNFEIGKDSTQKKLVIPVRITEQGVEKQ